MTVMALFTRKIGLRHITTTWSVVTSVSICPNAGLGARKQKTRRYFPGHQGSLDLTPCDIFLWGYIKDFIFLLPLPQDLPELRRWMIAATSEIDGGMLQRIWGDVVYRLDVFCVTESGHSEHLWGNPPPHPPEKRERKKGDFFFPPVRRLLQSIPPFKSKDFMIIIRQGITNNTLCLDSALLHRLLTVSLVPLVMFLPLHQSAWRQRILSHFCLFLARAAL
jgi:hypothetical protein